jgi:nitrogen regulatory protein PII
MKNLIAGMTVWESREHGKGMYQTVSYRGVEYEVGSNSITLEIVSDQSWVDDVITKIAEAHKKERFSVRRLYIFDVEASYHIRNGFMDI